MEIVFPCQYYYSVLAHEEVSVAFVCAACPLSEFNMFYSGVRQCYGLPAYEEDAASKKAEFEAFIRRLFVRPPSPRIMKAIENIADGEVKSLDQNAVAFYLTNVVVNLDQALHICVETLEQSQSDLWYSTRLSRISGSKCYALHTYFVNKSPDWDAKYTSMYCSSFSGDSNILYGLKCEEPSRDQFKKEHKCSVVEVGCYIRPEVPYLCYSPDGIIVNPQGDILGLFETKAPIEGKRHTADELVDNNLVKSLDRNGNLKTKCAWYGQVQLGMFLLGLDTTKFVIYSSFQDENHTPSIRAIDVKFDEEFILEMCTGLTKVFFRYLLPRMIQQHNNNNDMDVE